MKIILLVLFSVILNSANCQNFMREKYNKVFPNNKSIQIEKLQHEKDSLAKVNDSLHTAQSYALDRINFMKQEVVSLKTDLYSQQENSKNTHDELEYKVVVLRDSIAILSFPLVSCKEEILITKGKVDPVIVNTCVWRKYQINEKGTADTKGRYIWTTELFEKKGDSLIKISNVDLFKAEKIGELEKMINDRLDEDFKAMKLSDAECFNRRKYYPTFKLKDMRLAFNDNSEISFEIEYGLTDACFAVNSASTNFKIVDLKEYFVE